MKQVLKSSIQVLLFGAVFQAPASFAGTLNQVTANPSVRGGTGFSSQALGGSGIDALGGSGVQALGGSGVQALGGSGVQALGGSGIDALGGSGIDALGGSGIDALGGSGIDALGGSGIDALGGSGVQALGGSGAANLGLGNLGTTSNPNRMLIVGPIEMVDQVDSRVTILGQLIQMTDVMFSKAIEFSATGASLEIAVRQGPSGLVALGLKQSSNYYVAGSSVVTISGSAKWHKKDVGLIEIGEAIVDITFLLGQSTGVGTIDTRALSFTGIQPVPGGVIIAGLGY